MDSTYMSEEMIQRRQQFLRSLATAQTPDDLLRKGKVKKVGRNDPCPCGSKKKNKHCCDIERVRMKS